MTTTYIDSLLAAPEQYQSRIEDLLHTYRVLPVGTGYIDLIVARGRATDLVRALAELPVIVQAVTWWCFCTIARTPAEGCPHGYGGPGNPDGEGWFSKCCDYPWFRVAEHGVDLDTMPGGPEATARVCGGIVSDYIDQGVMETEYYSDCLQPGLWLYVPDRWRRLSYRVV